MATSENSVIPFSDRPLPETPDALKWVVEKQHQALQKYSVDLKKNLCLSTSYILDYMEQSGILTSNEADVIRTGSSHRKDQVSSLLAFVKRKGHKGFDQFVDALEEEYEYLVKKLQPYKSQYLIDKSTPISPPNVAQCEEEDPYYLPLTAEDEYETPGFTKCPNKPLNYFEENPSYILKGRVQAGVLNPDSVSAFLTLLKDMKSTKEIKGFNEYLSQNFLVDDTYATLPTVEEDMKNEIDSSLSSGNTVTSSSTLKQVDYANSSSPMEASRRNQAEENPALKSGANNLHDYSEIPTQESEITEKVDETKKKQFVDETVPTEENDFETIILPYLEKDKLNLLAGSNVIMCQESTNILCEAFKSNRYCLVYTKSNALVLLESSAIKRVGDPQGESWYFPVKVTSVQMERLLAETNQRGSFYVYSTTKSSADVPYNLSVHTSESGDVMHYHIHKNDDNEMVLKQGEDSIKFQNIQTLVDYFRLNRGGLACRLRWSPKELEFYKPNFPASRELDAEILLVHYHHNLENSKLGCGTSFIYKGSFNKRDVVVKTPSNFPLSKSDEDDFLTEARLLDQIKHQNIRKLIGVCYMDDNPHLILEYGGECNLLEYVQKNEQDAKLIVEMFVQVLNALKYLSEKKYIIHRDIAARNCLVQVNSEIRVQLADFGMAVKVVEYDEYYADGDERYSYRWAAPEVLKHNRFSTKSDIWAAGLLFWELANGGKMPFQNLLTNEEVASAVTRGDVSLSIPNTSNCKSLRHMFKEYIEPCWNYKPEDRPSARRLFLACRHCLGSICDGGKFDPLYGVHHQSISNLPKKSKKSVRRKLKSLFNMK